MTIALPSPIRLRRVSSIDQNTRDVSPSDDHQTMTRDLKQNTLLTRVIYTRVCSDYGSSSDAFAISVKSPKHEAFTPPRRRCSMPDGLRCGASRSSITACTAVPSFLLLWRAHGCHRTRAFAKLELAFSVVHASVSAALDDPSKSRRRASASADASIPSAFAASLKMASSRATSANVRTCFSSCHHGSAARLCTVRAHNAPTAAPIAAQLAAANLPLVESVPTTMPTAAPLAPPIAMNLEEDSMVARDDRATTRLVSKRSVGTCPTVYLPCT